MTTPDIATAGVTRREDDSELPSAEAVRELLKPLTQRQIEALAERSGISWPTLRKIKYGQTLNPGLDTVRAFLPHVADVLRDVSPTLQEAAKRAGC